jgi:HD-GYP domain-containing protein (c-di-GMP phosphodiesterase class II)
VHGHSNGSAIRDHHAKNGYIAREIKNIRISALLHDVGKIGIDDRILRKPGALNDDEFEVMKTHPAKGAATWSRPRLMRSSRE